MDDRLIFPYGQVFNPAPQLYQLLLRDSRGIYMLHLFLLNFSIIAILPFQLKNKRKSKVIIAASTCPTLFFNIRTLILCPPSLFI